MNPLREWASKHDGNFMYKWSQYFDVYHKHFERFRDKEIRILEIGIFGGGSLQMWKWYFGKKAHIVGMDIDPFCKKYEEPRIKIKIGDQANAEYLKTLGNFDIIIDDGGHTMNQQITSFEVLYDHLNNNGVYLVEDTHTSYIPRYQDASLSFIDYCKKLIDVMHEHYKSDTYSDFARMTDSVSFYDSMVVFEKREHDRPVQTYHSGVNRR